MTTPSKRIIITYWRFEADGNETVLHTDFIGGNDAKKAKSEAKKKVKELGEGHGAWVSIQTLNKGQHGRITWDFWDHSDSETCTIGYTNGKAKIWNDFKV